MINNVNVDYDSTNYYVLGDTSPRLLVDCGFPQTLPKLQQQCQRKDLDLATIPHILATHYHPDHAGLIPELVALGLKLLLIDLQIPAVPLMSRYMKPELRFQGIDLSKAVTVTIDQSHAFLATIGIQGQIIATPGHSDDSVSLILDSGEAFTGDLTHPMLMADDAGLLHESWARLRSLGATTIYGGHGPGWKIDSIDWGSG